MIYTIKKVQVIDNEGKEEDWERKKKKTIFLTLPMLFIIIFVNYVCITNDNNSMKNFV